MAHDVTNRIAPQHTWQLAKKAMMPSRDGLCGSGTSSRARLDRRQRQASGLGDRTAPGTLLHAQLPRLGGSGVLQLRKRGNTAGHLCVIQ